MSTSRRVIVPALVLACAPVVADAANLYTQTFETPHATALNHFDIFTVDRANGPAEVYGIAGDTNAVFDFDYGQYTYIRKDEEGIEDIADFIPLSPRSPNGTRTALRLDANNVAPNGGAIINVLPKIGQFVGSQLPSGDHRVTFDLWMNYNGPATGGVGSTEFMIAGINQEPGSVGGTSLPQGGLGVHTFTDPNPAHQRGGQGMAFDGERGNGLDYRFYAATTRVGSLDYPSGYLASSETVGTSTYLPGNGLNSFYQTMFPEPIYETGGAPGKKWVQVEMAYVDGIVYYYLNNTLIAARTDASRTSGNIMLGYGDIISTTSTPAALEPRTGSVDANFVLYDNVSVDTVTQTRPTWNKPGSGTWSNAANWNSGTPDGNTATADFTSSITGPTTITVDGQKTVRSVVLDNASPITLAGPGPLVLDSITTGIQGTFVVRSGSHTVTVPLVLNRDLRMDVAAGSSLTFPNDLPTTTLAFRKAGAGTATINHARVGAFGIVVEGGTLKIAPNGTPAGTSKTQSITFGGGVTAPAGQLDLTNNDLVLDYTGTTSPANNVRQLLASARNTGNWDGNGITSSTAAADASKAKGIAAVEASDFLGLTGTDTASWSGQTVDATSLLLTLAYYGDVNLDGKTDLDDYVRMDRAVAMALPAKWVNGDFNYDNAVNSSDYLLMDTAFVGQGAPLSAEFIAQREAQFGGDYVAALVAAVPEPSALGLVAAGVPLVLRRRRSR